MELNLDYEKLAALIAADLRQRPVPTDWLSPEALSGYLGGIPVRTIEDWRRKGTGPDYVTVGKHVRYNKAAVDRWLEGQGRDRTTVNAA